MGHDPGIYSCALTLEAYSLLNILKLKLTQPSLQQVLVCACGVHMCQGYAF